MMNHHPQKDFERQSTANTVVQLHQSAIQAEQKHPSYFYTVITFLQLARR
jgi:hypothetical protein